MAGNEFVYIDRQKDFAEACGEAAKCDLLAIDTEFVGEKSYWPRLEVIQFAAGDRIYIIDAVAVRDLSALSPVLASETVMKIFHAADSDLRILERATGVRPAPMFDTQVAASLLGYGAQISLVNLVRELLGVRLSGKQTTSDWSQRPLTKEQLSYAADDVAHLAAVYTKLQAELVQAGRWSWYEDEQRERLEHSYGDNNDDSPEEAHRRVKNWMSLSPRELAILRELAIWREKTAQERDLPRRSILSDEAMVELARFQPATREKAKQIRAANVGQILRQFDDILGVMKQGQKMPKETWPEKPLAERIDVPTGLQEICLALLRVEADRLRVAPNVFATTADLQEIINNRDDLKEDRIPLLHGWRREAVGEKILRLLRGEISLSVNKEGNVVIEER